MTDSEATVTIENMETLSPSGMDFGKPGWTYCDLPSMTPECFDRYVGIIGAHNIHWLSFAERMWPDRSVTVRGQHLISPQGMANGRAYAAELR